MAHRGAVIIMVVKLVNFNALQAAAVNGFNNIIQQWP